MSQMPDSEKLHLFVERCQELLDSRIWREGGLSLRLEVGKQLEEPDVDNLRSFLMVFRQFVAPREPVFFETVIKIGKEHLAAGHADEAVRFETYLQKWEAALQHSTVNITVDNEKLSPRHVLEVFIDGQYFHNDVSDRAELARFSKFAVRVDRIQFIQTVADLTEIIFVTGNTIGFGLNNQWFDFA